jgi:hypothetical protein
MPKASNKLVGLWIRAIAVTTLLVIAAVWLSRNYLAGLIAEKPSIHNLALAQKYSPSDAVYPHLEGRLLLYSVSDADPTRALSELTRAVELNAYEPQEWLDLASALELEGQVDEAEECIRRADFLAPRQPQFQWAIANFFILHGDIDESFKHLKMVLASDSSYDATIYNTAWKASGDAGKILKELIPDAPDAEFRYLYYLISTGRYPEADAVWNRIMANGGKFAPQFTSGYIETLIAAHRPDDAYSVWEALRAKGIIAPTYEETPQNLIENGDFEETPMNMGFDWRMSTVGGVYIGLDQTTFHSPGHSLLVQFDGKGNYDFQNVYQLVLVKPGGAYQLRAFMKTDGITTDSGPRLEIRDAYDSRNLDVSTKNLVGSTPGWVLVSQDFRAGLKTHLIAVELRRYPSQKFDNSISGKVWLDDVTLAGSTGRN